MLGILTILISFIFPIIGEIVGFAIGSDTLVVVCLIYLIVSIVVHGGIILLGYLKTKKEEKNIRV